MLDGPLHALPHFVRELRQRTRGAELQAGEVVTGAWTTRGRLIMVRYGPLNSTRLFSCWKSRPVDGRDGLRDTASKGLNADHRRTFGTFVLSQELRCVGSSRRARNASPLKLTRRHKYPSTSRSSLTV